MKTYNISQKEFCRIWQNAETPEDVARLTGMPKPIAIARAASYRNLGINLKKMKRKTKAAIDVQEINRFLRELENEPPATMPVQENEDIEINEDIKKAVTLV